MSESAYVPNYTLMCLCLASECRALASAADVPTSELRTRFLRMAGAWTELANESHVLH